MSNQHKTQQKVFLALVSLALVSISTAGHAAEIDGDTLTVRWDANDPAESITGYELHYDLQGGPPYAGTFADQGPSPIDIPVASLEDPQKPVFKISGIPPCSTIFLRMKAYNDSATSDFTEEISATVAYKPQNVQVKPASAESAEVSWNAPPPGYIEKISRYLVYYDMQPAEMAAPESSGYRYMVEVLPSELQDASMPRVMLDGLLGGMRVNVAVSATCLGGENDLSEPTATQTPKRGERIEDIDKGLFDGDLRGGCGVGAQKPSRLDGSWALLLLLALYFRRQRQQ